MNKSAAKIAVAALAIPLFGGFATYAAAQVSSKPTPQVVIPAVPTTDDRGGTHQVSPAGGHDVNDDNSAVGNSDDSSNTSIAKVSDDPATHDATDVATRSRSLTVTVTSVACACVNTLRLSLIHI